MAKDEIDEEIRRFLPNKISKGWLEANIGSASWVYDEEALNKTVMEPINEFIARGGKRWRPVLMLLCCEAVGGRKEGAKRFAIIPELIHNGTLMVDDVEDNSELRRGKPCIYKLYGADVAINAGNLLYYLPLVVMKKSGLDDKRRNAIYELVNEEMLKLGLGQATDIYWHKGKKEPREAEYLQMCANKTGVLARMAAKLGAIIGNGNEKQIEALGRFAEALGVAFQIRDDMLNLTGDLGKGFGDDISEGKRSLMVIKTFEAAGKKDKERLKEILGKHTKNKEEINEAIEIIKGYDTLDYAKKKAEEIVKNAWKEADSVLEESDAKKKLKELADFLIERKV